MANPETARRDAAVMNVSPRGGRWEPTDADREMAKGLEREADENGGDWEWETEFVDLVGLMCGHDMQCDDVPDEDAPPTKLIRLVRHWVDFVWRVPMKWGPGMLFLMEDAQADEMVANGYAEYEAEVMAERKMVEPQ